MVGSQTVKSRNKKLRNNLLNFVGQNSLLGKQNKNKVKCMKKNECNS